VAFPVVEPEPVEHEAEEAPAPPPDPFAVVESVRRLLGDVAPAEEASMRRFSATELQRFQNCPRQYYYARLLRIPSGESRAGARHAAEASSPGRMTPTLRGIVIHRFCETYVAGEPIEERLRHCMTEVRTARGDEFVDVLSGIDDAGAVAQVLPYARNYVESRMRLRVDERLQAGRVLPNGQHEFVRSEVPFTLRTRHGFVVGAIDKVLFTPLASGRVRAYIVDFKTSRLRGSGAALRAAVEKEAAEHRLQMQIYAQAIRRLVPNVGVTEAALHFLEPGPNVEFEFAADVIGEVRASEDIDRAMAGIVSGKLDPASFEAKPGGRCEWCRYNGFCPDAEAPALAVEPAEVAE
jgi:ATP-dependent exoDNAse (exonuclease V) beta subunit